MFELNLVGLFLSSFVAATVFPMPSELQLAVLISEGYPKLACLILATLGNSLGSVLTYYMGRFCKWELISKYLNIKQDKIESFSQRISKRVYIYSLLVWLPIIGDLICLALGFLKTPPARTIVFITIGKMIRYLIVIYFVGFTF
jgi:membrane protein YqaA with SNARE-associated domain